ncbi:hypothetical protein QE152_g27078 [Popillia japonica]|uniref:Uncharacterized protein n=1 Tax=Popillia japonica TaxID=7064 RepID=A0AAW1JUL5_POPJA
MNFLVSWIWMKLMITKLLIQMLEGTVMQKILEMKIAVIPREAQLQQLPHQLSLTVMQKILEMKIAVIPREAQLQQLPHQLSLQIAMQILISLVMIRLLTPIIYLPDSVADPNYIPTADKQQRRPENTQSDLSEEEVSSQSEQEDEDFDFGKSGRDPALFSQFNFNRPFGPNTEVDTGAPINIFFTYFLWTNVGIDGRTIKFIWRAKWCSVEPVHSKIEGLFTNADYNGLPLLASNSLVLVLK